MLPFNFEDWTVDHTCQYLKEELQEDKWCAIFKEKEIDGTKLRGLTDDKLQEIGIEDLDDREKILLCIRKLWQIHGKVFNDPIHGHMKLHPLLVKIIDTPQFQRLRDMKQLGGAYFVYPGASHNRFEHSIGVGHLAGELAKALKTNQPRLDITDRDILCVEIAGLCHDLGHGPFSHLFDAMFIPKARPGCTWKHEVASLDMFDHLVKSNELERVMKLYNLVPEKDLVFIKEMIAGPFTINAEGKNELTSEDKKWPYKGRPEEKSFLYEIVANKITGIDVDKFDYFARDCHHLGIKNNFDHHRYITFARVCEVQEKDLKRKHICLRDKEEDNMTEMFHTRYSLHKKAYQHKVTEIIQIMIKDALLEANGHIQIEGKGGEEFTLSEAFDDMEAYTKLTDNVFEQILHAPSTKQDLKKSKDILHRVIKRKLYTFLGETRDNQPKETIDGWKGELAEKLSTESDQLTLEDFEIMVVKLDYGMKDMDPIERLNFYRKYDTTKAFKKMPCQRPRIRPTSFQEQLVRFYLKRENCDLKLVKERFEEWCTEKEFPEYLD